MAGRPLHRCLGYNNNHCPALLYKDSRCRSCRTLMYGRAHQAHSKRARAAQPWCTWCGSRDNLELDHVIPGTTTGGTQVLCHPCNLLKAKGTPPPPLLS
jgi:hypothetical protein